MRVRKAVIPVGGFATRFLPACKSVPKCMLNIVDKPIIQYIVDEAIESGIEEIVLIVGRKKEIVMDYFSDDVGLKEFLTERGKKEYIKQIDNLNGNAKIHFIDQGEAKGLGHAIYMAKDIIGNEPFAIMYGDVIMQSDIPCLKQIIKKAEELETSVIGVEKVSKEDVSKYGNVAGVEVNSNLQKVTTLIEKPTLEQAKSNLAVMDRHVLMPELFNVLENTKPGHGGEIQVTDAYAELAKMGKGLYAYEYDSVRFDSGGKAGFVKASIHCALKNTEIKDEIMEYIKGINS